MVIHDSLSIAPNDRRINTVGETVSHDEKTERRFQGSSRVQKEEKG